MDMPIVQPPPGEDQPIGQASIVIGPYLASADAMQPFLHFVTNRRCVAGVESLESKRKYVNRQASFSLFHSLAIPELDAEQLRRYQFWLDDRDGGAYAIRGLPRSGQATTIGFAGGRADGGGRLAAVGEMLRRLDTNAVVFASPPFAAGVPEDASEWESLFFSPLGDKVAFGPMWFAPGNGLPDELFPEQGKEGGYWKRDVGALRIIGIDARAFNFESSLQAVMARLDRDLDPGHIKRAWTVVVLSRGIFDARVGDGRILSALGDRLELGGVDLVIGPGQYYVRSRPFGGGGGQTRYITIADGPEGPDPRLEPREYVAALSGQAHVGRLWADEGTLEWQVFDLQGRSLDILTLDARRVPLEPSLSKWEVTSDAQATLTLQKEILRIVRQAARALPDPAARTMLSLSFANPTTKRFAGTLAWETDPASGWRLEPPTLPFDLQPGQGAVARFVVTPGSPERPPVLLAAARDVGSSSGRLVLARERAYSVQATPDPVRLDARPRDKSYWRNFAPIGEFQTADGGVPANPTEARITADRDGLIIGMSMTAKAVSSGNPKAYDPEEHNDGPVLADESMEICIDPGRRGRDYYRFAINPQNVVMDESSRDGISYNPVWRHAARFGRAGDNETWDAEIRIPWEAVGLAAAPSPGDEWGIQFVRRDNMAAREAGERRSRRHFEPAVSEWAPAGGDNTRPGLYGALRFGDLSSAPSGDGIHAAPEPAGGGFLIRGGQIPARPGRILPSVSPPPPPPDFQ